MTVRTTALGAAAALALFGHAAVAEEPIKLDQYQMDHVTAGSFPRWVLNWDGDQWFTSRQPLYSLGQANASSQANATSQGGPSRPFDDFLPDPVCSVFSCRVNLSAPSGLPPFPILPFPPEE